MKKILVPILKVITIILFGPFMLLSAIAISFLMILDNVK
jgi:hypothetical protein